MNINFFQPTDALIKNSIHAIWQIDRINAFKNEYIIPKGQVEVIFNFSNDISMLAEINNKAIQLPATFINGFNKTSIHNQLPVHQSFLGVVFRPSAIKKIFGYNAAEFADTAIDLSLVDKSIDSLHEQLSVQTDFDSRVKLLTGWLNIKMPVTDPREQLLNEFLYAGNKHEISLTALAGSLYYSPRHLSRKLKELTGMNTEEILLYKKYLHALQLVQYSDMSLTAIAYQSNFSDQSHFTRTFKTFTGLTPLAYKQTKSEVMGHIYKHVR